MLQLQLFASAVFMLYPQVEKVVSGFVWLAHDQTTTVIYKREHYPIMWDRIAAQIDVVQDAVDLGVFVAKPSPLCNWCAAKHICKYK